MFLTTAIPRELPVATNHTIVRSLQNYNNNDDNIRMKHTGAICTLRNTFRVCPNNVPEIFNHFFFLVKNIRKMNRTKTVSYVNITHDLFILHRYIYRYITTYTCAVTKYDYRVYNFVQ